MIKKLSRQELRSQRHHRARKKVIGTSSRPRLSVFRSEKQIYAQFIDDLSAKTLVSASSLDDEVKQAMASGEGKIQNKPSQVAKAVGALAAKRALEKGISEVVFDRGGFKFHGRIQVLANSAREAGLKF